MYDKLDVITFNDVSKEVWCVNDGFRLEWGLDLINDFNEIWENIFV